MVKVLCITWKFVQEGGVTGFIMNYFRHIDACRIQLDFLVISEDSSKTVLEEIQGRNSQVYCVPVLGRKNIISIWKSLQCFFQKHENEYKIIHSHLYQLNWLLFYFAKKYGAEICIAHAHATKWADYRLRAIRNRIMALPVRYCADVWGACSIAAGEFLYGKDFLHSSKHWVLHNAIEVERFIFNEKLRKKTRQELGYTDEIVLGTVGRLAPQKNQTFLLDIMKLLLEKGQTQYRILIVGDGELRENLPEKAKRIGVYEFVLFVGTRIDIPEMLWAMDYFLLPSHYEGLPISGIEAQAAGLFCLFSDKITKEANISSATYLSIDQGAEVWADVILAMDGKQRCMDAVRNVTDAGYDIKIEAKRFEDKYLTLLKKIE